MQQSPATEASIQQLRSQIADLTEKLQTLPTNQLNALNQDIQDLKAALDQFSVPIPARSEHALFEVTDGEDLFLRSLFEADPGGVAVVTHPDLVYRLVNQAYRSMTPDPGIDPLGLPMETIWPERDADGTRAVFKEILATGKSMNSEYQLLDQHGSTHYYTYHVLPISWNGNPALVQLFWETTQLRRDRVALAEANAQLAEERNRLLAVMQSVPVALALHDSKGGLITTNQIFTEIWGDPLPLPNTVDDYQQYKGWWVDTGKPVQPEEWAAARAVAKGETTIGQYVRIQKFDGSQAYVLNSAAPIRDADGRVTGAVVAIMDVSEHVRTEQALRESEERFRVALSALPMMVYRMDADLRYTWVYNSHPVYQQKDVLGKNDEELFNDAAAPFVLAKRFVLQSGQGAQREVSAMIGSEMKTYLITLEPILDSEGHATGLIGASLDVTEQKRIEKERLAALAQSVVQRQLLENREKERQALARDLHDGPIQLLSSTLFNLQVVKEATDDPVMQLEVSQASLNLKTAVRDLRGVMNELRPPALIRFGFTKSARMYAEDFRERNPDIELNVHLIDDKELLSESAHLALFRIYQESLNNILRHAKATKIWVQLNRKRNQVRMHIHDNGQGFKVPPDFSEQIQRGHYGLAGMKERAEALGGKFSILSVAGVGTTITVTIPISGKEEN